MHRITLSNLQEVTEQQVFDRICAHLFTQMMKSENRGCCKYRQAILGLSCAVGCLVADDEYQRNWEGAPWEYVIREWGVADKHSHLLIDMQDLHDTYYPNEWYLGMVAIAKRHNLEFKHGR